MANWWKWLIDKGWREGNRGWSELSWASGFMERGITVEMAADLHFVELIARNHSTALSVLLCTTT